MEADISIWHKSGHFYFALTHSCRLVLIRFPGPQQAPSFGLTFRWRADYARGPIASFPENCPNWRARTGFDT